MQLPPVPNLLLEEEQKVKEKQTVTSTTPTTLKAAVSSVCESPFSLPSWGHSADTQQELHNLSTRLCCSKEESDFYRREAGKFFCIYVDFIG